jgi:hypothetical protein
MCPSSSGVCWGSLWGCASGCQRCARAQQHRAESAHHHPLSDGGLCGGVRKRVSETCARSTTSSSLSSTIRCLMAVSVGVRKRKSDMRAPIYITSCPSSTIRCLMAVSVGVRKRKSDMRAPIYITSCPSSIIRCLMTIAVGGASRCHREMHAPNYIYAACPPPSAV